MTPMSGALDWLAVGDIAEERGADHRALLGGGAARLALHAAALGAKASLVAKVGDDAIARRLRDALTRQGVDLRWLREATQTPTTVWHEPDGTPQQRRVERGADLALRRDEMPPPSVRASLTVASGYSLSVEPARSAVLGALAGAAAREGRAALLVEAELLWWTNARITRRVLEEALAMAHSVALSTADACILFGSVSSRQAIRQLAQLGPKVIYLAGADGSVLVRDAGRIHEFPAQRGAALLVDRFAGPAAFWVRLARGAAAQQAALESMRYAGSARQAGARL
jgi:sugar/nucleoside kinase (ribokinase family)